MMTSIIPAAADDDDGDNGVTMTVVVASHTHGSMCTPNPVTPCSGMQGPPPRALIGPRPGGVASLSNPQHGRQSTNDRAGDVTTYVIVSSP
jgi:hypothetical protein